MRENLTYTLPPLADQAARDAFAKDIDNNFSVIAPAGVGKTTAITQRVLHFIEQALATDPEKISQLVVVTYTQKAANEMLQRVHSGLRSKHVPPLVFNLLNRAFFGTIHSFCLKIINTYGYTMGIPADLKVLTDLPSLEAEFIRHAPSLEILLSDSYFDPIKKFLDIDDFLSFALTIPVDIKVADPTEPMPFVAIDSLLTFDFKKKLSENVVNYLSQLNDWKEVYKTNVDAIGLPLEPSGSGEFKSLVFDAFAPLWRWLNHFTLNAAKKVALLFQAFRLEKGLITHDDIISVAFKLIQNKETMAKIHLQGLRVILDEAQDTDPQQFAILLSIVPQAENSSCFPGTSAPRSGSFCMVGDPQQSIYSSRADLPTYMQIHKALIDSGNAQALTFKVTMRCDETIVDCVNSLFPSILKPNDAFTQVPFVPLIARPEASKGFVLKLDPLKNNPPPETEDALQLEANYLAQWLQKNYTALGIDRWDQLAFLTPRKSWLVPIEAALKTTGINCQVHSQDVINGDNPAYAWIAALAAILVDPLNTFEVTGVLREIFGLSDHAIAHYVLQNTSLNQNGQKNLHPLCILFSTTSKDNVGMALNQLHLLYEAAQGMPVYNGINLCVERLELYQKLGALSFHDPEDSLNVLDELLTQAASADAQGLSLLDFARQLKIHFAVEKSSSAPIKDHVQLLTCHKAKGLEWSVVILPFLFKDILFPSTTFPRLYNIPLPGYPKAAISNHPLKDVYDADLRNYRFLEIERLVYVATTRASQKLIFVNDANLFPKSKISLAHLLQLPSGATNNTYWQTLPSELPPAAVAQMPVPTSVAYSPQSSIHITQAFEHLSIAHKKASLIPKKITPSQLSNTQEKIKHNHFLNTNAMEYGVWWHEVMNQMPWTSPEKWQVVFETYLKDCPDAVRAQKEFSLLMQSPIRQWCSTEKTVIQTEVPVLASTHPMEIMEGNMDVLACVPGQAIPWIILDWKTDAASTEMLKAQYAPQLKAYRDLVTKVVQQPVAMYLYATRTGESVLVEC